MRSARASGASSPKVRSMERAALARTRPSRSVGGGAAWATGRGGAGLETAMTAAAPNIIPTATQSSRLRAAATAATHAPRTTDIQPKPPNPERRPLSQEKYATVIVAAALRSLAAEAYCVSPSTAKSIAAHRNQETAPAKPPSGEENAARRPVRETSIPWYRSARPSDTCRSERGRLVSSPS